MRRLVTLGLLTLAVGCHTGAGRTSTVGGTHVAHCDVPLGDDAEHARVTVQDDSEAIPLSQDMAIGPYPVGTEICVERVDSGGLARLEIVGQPDDGSDELTISAEAARQLGIQDRNSVRVRLRATAPPSG